MLESSWSDLLDELSCEEQMRYYCWPRSYMLFQVIHRAHHILVHYSCVTFHALLKHLTQSPQEGYKKRLDKKKLLFWYYSLYIVCIRLVQRHLGKKLLIQTKPAASTAVMVILPPFPSPPMLAKVNTNIVRLRACP